MERTPVKSSNVASIGYEEPTKTLEVRFLSGSVYQHFGVEPQLHADLMAADSIGRFYHQNIVKAGFKTQKMDPEQENE